MREASWPEASHLVATRTAYDTVATDCTRLLEAELSARPLDRAMLAAFADLMRDADVGQVIDVGCGPGRVTALLSALGVDAFGIDLSPAMVAEARRRHPHLRFDVGVMTAVELPDASVGGIVAWYSIMHTPPDELPDVFTEFCRLLAPGGHLLLAFQVGDEQIRVEQGYGHDVSLDAYRLAPDRISDLLANAGITVTARLVRDPARGERVPQAFLLA